MATIVAKFNANNTNYNTQSHPESSNYASMVKVGDSFQANVTDPAQIGSQIRYINASSISILNNPDLLAIDNGFPTRKWQVSSSNTSNSDHYARYFLFTANAGTIANKISFRVLYIPTTVGWNIVPNMNPGVSATATLQMPTTFNSFLNGIGPFASQYGAATFEPSQWTNGNERFYWRISRNPPATSPSTSQVNHNATTHFVNNSGTISPPQNGTTLTLQPNANASGTYYLNLYHPIFQDSAGDFNSTSVGKLKAVNLLDSRPFTVSSGLTAPTISLAVAAAGDINGYRLAVTPSGGVGGTAQYTYFSNTSLAGAAATTVGPTASAELLLGSEWQGSTWTVTPRAVLGAAVEVGTAVSITIPQLDLVVGVPNPGVLLNSNSTFQAPQITGTGSNTRYFITPVNYNLGQAQGIAITNYTGTFVGRTWDTSATRTFKGTGGSTTNVTDIPSEGTGKPYYIYAYAEGAGLSNTAAGFVSTGLSFITERPDTNISVSASPTFLNPTGSGLVLNNVTVTLSNQSTTTQYRVLSTVRPQSYSAWVKTINGSAVTGTLEEDKLPPNGGSDTYKIQARVLPGSGGIGGPDTSFQDTTATPFTITRGDAIIGTTAISLTYSDQNIPSPTYLVIFTINPGSGGGTLQFAIEQGDSTPDNWTTASSDTQTTFTATFTRGNTTTIYAQARRGSIVSSVLSLAGLGYLPSDNDVTVTAPTQVAFASTTGVDIVVTGVARPTEIVAVRENGTTTNLDQEVGNNVTLRIPNSNLPTAGNSKSYIIVTKRPTSTGGDGSTFSTASSVFSILRLTDTGTTGTPTQVFSPLSSHNYGLRITGSGGNTDVFNPFNRTLNIIKIQTVSLQPSAQADITGIEDAEDPTKVQVIVLPTNPVDLYNLNVIRNPTSVGDNIIRIKRGTAILSLFFAAVSVKVIIVRMG